jgi:uncharacterized protein (TIRG00374 family)
VNGSNSHANTPPRRRFRPSKCGVGMCNHAAVRRSRDHPKPMKIGPALIGFGLLTVLYVGALVLIDRQHHVFEHGADLGFLLPKVALVVLVSIVLRYVRWHWLLGRRDFRVGWIFGFLAYVSGFALTATPGKVGELMRVRYFGAVGVPADQVIACFVFERLLDLATVLLLSLPLARFDPAAALAFAFVALVAVAVVVLSRSATLWASLAQWLQDRRWHRSATILLNLGKGLSGAIGFFRPLELMVAMTLGLAAWTIQSLGSAYLLAELGMNVPPLAAFALYPFALLVGVVSMLPGGIGTTEAAIVFLLHGFGVPLQDAALAAIGLRLSSLWFAIALGFVAIPILELLARKTDPRRDDKSGAETAT